LALHKAGGPAGAAPSSPETPAGRCRPGIAVPDIDEFHQRMLAHGMTCLQEPKETFGVRIAQYLDPDGLAISVSEERRGG
jgi:predicted enzyme related to lactoylglutathione lyase